MPSLIWSNIVAGPENKTYPCLKGQVIKAANTRSYMGFVAYLAELCNDGSDFALRRMQVAQAARDLNQLWGAEPFFISSAGQARCAELVRIMLQGYSYLARMAVNEGLLWFNVVPKLHYASHLPRQSMLLSPRCTRTYLEESLVGRAQQMYQPNLRGQYARIIQDKFIIKYIFGIQIHFPNNLLDHH